MSLVNANLIKFSKSKVFGCLYLQKWSCYLVYYFEISIAHNMTQIHFADYCVDIYDNNFVSLAKCILRGHSFDACGPFY